MVVLPFIFSLFSIFTLFYKRDKNELEALKYSYLFGTFFSIGALVSLLFNVTTQDLAFGWATTLDIKASELSNFLNSLAIWKIFCSECTIDEHLANISKFVRLGSGGVSKDKIAYANELGSWWKFLALSIVFYGIIFRGALYLIVKYFSSKESSIKIESEKNRESLEEISNEYSNISSIDETKSREFRVIPYHIDIPKNLEPSENAKDILVVVKSWEPPILDFFDYLEELEEENSGSKIAIYLAGLKGRAKDEDIDIWKRKLNELNLNYELIY